MGIYNSNPTEFEKTFNNVQSDTELITHKLEEIKTKIIAKYELKRKWERYSNKLISLNLSMVILSRLILIA